MLDNGEIVTTDTDVLKLFIQSGQPTTMKLNEEQVTIQATKQNNYRKPDIRYEKNQIFIDCVEKVNCLINSIGQQMHADVQGEVNIDCQLSGMPDCSIQLNDRLSLQEKH